METKTSVVKSKSSNSAKTNRSEHHNKKCRSNAEFQPNVSKKRGVYVEKKPTAMGLDESAKNRAQERPMKAPPRPRAGNKKFLTSILTILSKSTTGTQYPDANDPVTKTKTRRRVNIRKNFNKTDDNDLKEVIIKRKPKYRSRALNDEVEKEVNHEQVLVLQSKKDMIQTPSIYSENDSLNLSNLPLLVKKGQGEEMIENNAKAVANELAKEIMEGRKIRKDKRVRIDEPTTIVGANTAKKPNVNDANEKDKRLYNFFVDLLETTISVYNVKAEYDKAPYPPSEGSSVKIPLEIDESVAKKLNIKNAKPHNTEEAAPPNQFYCLRDLEFGQQSAPPSQYESLLKCQRKKKFQAESFSFLKQPTKKKLKSQSMAETKKPYSRREKKKTLLNLFKEQLKMDDDAFEEPQNLYQALKVIAQNKRRCQKTIHFNDTRKKNKRDTGFPECMYKSRKVISPSTKSTKNKPIYTPSITGKYSEKSSAKKPRADFSDSEDSYHSLEVLGFDYEHPVARKPTNRDKQLVFTYHSTPSDSADDIGSKDILDVSESDSMFFNEYYN